MNKRHYPTEILPKSSYKRTIDIDEVVYHTGDITFSRRIDRKIEDCEIFNGKRMIETEDITEHIVNMSLNIHGGYFETQHIPFRQTKQGTDNWDGKDIDMTQYSECFEYKEECFPIFFKSADIHNQRFPYKKEIQKDSERNETQRKINRVLETFGDRQYIMIATIKVRHVPTMLNYWHGELTVYPEDSPQTPLDSKKGAWKKHLFHSLSEDIIQQKYTTTQPIINKIKEIFYKKH